MHLIARTLASQSVWQSCITCQGLLQLPPSTRHPQRTLRHSNKQTCCYANATQPWSTHGRLPRRRIAKPLIGTGAICCLCFVLFFPSELQDRSPDDARS